MVETRRSVRIVHYVVVSDKTFLEIRHGLGITPDMVIVQLRHGNRHEDWISDVTGTLLATCHTETSLNLNCKLGNTSLESFLF